MNALVIRGAPLPPPRFRLGRLSATPAAVDALTVGDIHGALSRHVRGDWGVLDENDTAANNEALATGGRLLSAYDSASGVRFYVITEADRSATTVLLPEDY